MLNGWVARARVKAGGRRNTRPRKSAWGILVNRVADTLRGQRPTTDRAKVDNILSMWESKPREVAEKIIEKYGPPEEATPSLLLWHNNGPWKKTVVHREEVPHHFPRPHTDIVEQFIDYKVPPEKHVELARYDGSVHAKRTEGELSARCDKEEMNFLAINLAHDIITGARTVDDARKTYTEKAMAAMMGKMDDYTQGLRFPVAKGNTGDKDEQTVTETMGAKVGETVDKVKDKLSGR